MANRISDTFLTGQDGRRPSDLTKPSWSPLRMTDIPLWPGYDGPERRSAKGRRGFERRFEARSDSTDRRVGHDRRLGHWLCLSGH